MARVLRAERACPTPAFGTFTDALLVTPGIVWAREHPDLLVLKLPFERPLFVGVVHLLPTPGAPRYGGTMGPVIEGAVHDAEALASGGCDALIVENFGDVPFHPGTVQPETVAAMALAVREVLAAVPALPVGVNVLRNDARAGLGLCAATGAGFLRVNVHTGAMVTDQGVIEGRAAETLRARSALAPGALILADVHVKHARPLGGGSIGEAARDAVVRGLADAVVVSGGATGLPTDPEDVQRVRGAVGPDVPILVGSGVDHDNARRMAACADGAIVGTALKRQGQLHQPVEEARVRAMRDVLAAHGS